MLNCSDPECILHHHHYYHGRVQHHLQDDRAHHEHPTHHPMSVESDGVQDAIIQDYLNDTDSELSSLSHLDAPSESVYAEFICGVLIAMIMVGFIIILLAITIRFKAPVKSVSCKCCSNFCKLSKLRKREESSGIHRSNVVHPEGVLQATIIGNAPPPNDFGTQDIVKASPLEDIFIAPVTNRKSFTSWNSDNSISGYSSETTQLPMFLYSTRNSRNSLNHSDVINAQDAAIHSSDSAGNEETNNNNNYDHTSNKEVSSGRKNIKGKLKKLVRRKSPPVESYALPLELREQLKQIYVY